MTEVYEQSIEDIQALMTRMESAIEHNLALETEDIRLSLAAMETLIHLLESGHDVRALRRKLAKILGKIPSTEKKSGKDEPDEESDKNKKKTRPPSSRKNRKQRGGRTPRQTVHHQFTESMKGKPCPCGYGTYHKVAPGRLLRITGATPFTSTLHITERVRCSACNEYVTADLPEEVLKDGTANQQYGYSARSLMALFKCGLTSPFYGQDKLLSQLGEPIAASTLFDQCQYVAQDCKPIVGCLIKQAAQDNLVGIDDTNNRIVQIEPIMKPNRTKEGERLRTGVYTSTLLSVGEGGRRIGLFQTNIGHAGEWADEVLRHREATKPPPLVMSDALPSNLVTVVACIAIYCNAHARRQFFELISVFEEEASWVIEQYEAIWKNDDQIAEENKTPAERLDYHKKHSLPVMEKIKAWAENGLMTGEIEANSALGKAVRYYLNHYDKLIGFCKYENAPLDNNSVEQLIKLIAKIRKNSYFYRTEKGAEVGDILTSVLTTCELNGVNPFEYLCSVQRNAEAVKREPEKWLPWNYEKNEM